MSGKNKYIALIGLLLIVSLCSLLFLPSIKWIGYSVLYNSESINLAIMLFIVVLFLKKQWFKKTEKGFFQALYINKTAIYFFLTSLLFHIILYHYVDLVSIASLTFGLSVFCFIGIFLSTQQWLNYFIPFILLMLTLPYGNLLDVYIGFPLRLKMAETLEHLLQSMNITYASSETIINIENRSIQIDNSCSGIKGLWSASIFFFIITWIEKLKIDFRWLLLYLLFLLMMLCANFIRITILVFLELVFVKPALADFLHLPMGLLGFLFSCISLVFVIKFCVKREILFTTTSQWWSKIPTASENKISSKKIFVLQVLTLSVVSFGLFLSKNSSLNDAPPSFNYSFHLPQEKTLALNPPERKAFKREGSTALKKSFSFASGSGTILIVKSSALKGHHHPELCTQGMGLKINKTSTVFIEKDFPLKLLSLNNGKHTACYWFQSSSSITDDFSSRIWSELRNKEKEWTMISILFNQHINIDSNSIILLRQIKNTIQNSKTPKIVQL